MNQKPNNGVRSGVAILSVGILTVLPLYIFVSKPPISGWLNHLQVYWQGIGVILACTIISSLICVFSKKASFGFVFALSILFLSSYGIIIQFAAGYLYFGALCIIGSAALSKGQSSVSNDITLNFLGGMCIWCFFAVLLSLFKLGGFNQLRILTVILFIISLVLLHNKQYQPLIVHYKNALLQLNKEWIPRTMFLFLTFFVLALAARTIIAWDHDSLWYGLRPEKVLIGDNSFYDNLGLVCFVYYYPKFVELLFAPLSDLGEFSYIMMGNIFIYILICVSCVRFFQKYLNWNLGSAVCTTLIFATIPAITGGAVGAKPDNMGVLCCLVGWTSFYGYLKNRKISELVFTFICLAICTAIKPTYLLQGGILFICILITSIPLWKERHSSLTPKIPKSELFVAGMGVLGVLGVHGRTLYLTGMPLYPMGVQIFSKLGFTAKYGFFEEFHTVSNTSTSFFSVFERIYQFIFDFGSLPHLKCPHCQDNNERKHREPEYSI